jgi:hypothetical protein
LPPRRNTGHAGRRFLMGLVENGTLADDLLTERGNVEENLGIELMVTLYKIESGLPANLYLDDTGSWSKFGDRRILKLQSNAGARSTRDTVAMSIEDNPQILGNSAKMKLNDKQLEQIKAFVRANKELLLQFADGKIDFLEFYNRIIKSKKRTRLFIVKPDKFGFLTSQENLDENIRLDLMIWMRKEETCLPANIFLDDTGGSRSHFMRWRIIMFQPNTRHFPVAFKNRVAMSIEDNPQILGNSTKMKLNDKQLEQIKAFVRANKELLLQLADAEISILEFGRKMARV